MQSDKTVGGIYRECCPIGEREEEDLIRRMQLWLPRRS